MPGGGDHLAPDRKPAAELDVVDARTRAPDPRGPRRRPHQALCDLAGHGLVASDGNTDTSDKIWRLAGAAGLDAAGHVLRIPRSDMGSTARGAGSFGVPHAIAANETVLAFVRGSTGPDAPGGIGTVASWATEVEFALGGHRKVRPDAVREAPKIGVPVLMLEVDRSTTSPAKVAAKFAGSRELLPPEPGTTTRRRPGSGRRSGWVTGGAAPTRATSGRAVRPSPWSSPAPAPRR
ncbi:replication-relaxation family protein [Kitasatospora phosalacinea]|uniref:replication-relaxation family protein n=1 Tax=Kitasatospora phosalacinea TaxID=2065 RepID=UPI0035D81F20